MNLEKQRGQPAKYEIARQTLKLVGEKGEKTGTSSGLPNYASGLKPFLIY
jgi:hypothetical protein